MNLRLTLATALTAVLGFVSISAFGQWCPVAHASEPAHEIRAGSQASPSGELP